MRVMAINKKPTAVWTFLSPEVEANETPLAAVLEADPAANKRTRTLAELPPASNG